MSDPKQTSERLQAIIAESKRTARETQALIDLTRRLSAADARLARALREVSTDLNEGAPRRKDGGVIPISAFMEPDSVTKQSVRKLSRPAPNRP